MIGNIYENKLHRLFLALPRLSIFRNREYTRTADVYESTSWSVFSCIKHFHLQKCFYFIFLHF